MNSGEAKILVSAIFRTRLLAGLAQGIALWLLLDAAVKTASWPATDPLLFTPLLLAACYVPIILIAGLGQLQARPLAAWAGAVAIFVLAVGFHSAARGAVSQNGGAGAVRDWRAVWVALPAALFIAHVLVVDSVTERRLFPSYRRHFDTAWKLAVQLLLALIFTGVFWIVLWLGATLFGLVKLYAFRDLITHAWFAWPASALAFACAVHVTDVEPSLIRGARSLGLTLFSWLLPILAAIVWAFLAVLPFMPLDTLWHTRIATSLLLSATFLLVLLINSAYQDGAAEQTQSRLKRIAGTAGAAALPPLAALAVWGLWLRVAEYGWTEQRVLAASLAVPACCYAAGYATAVPSWRVWLKRIEITNFVTAYVVLAIIVSLLSPVADPARLMVASQLARLQSGAVTPEKFDFVSLRFDGARWGDAALAALSQESGSPTADSIARDARAARALANRYPGAPAGVAKPTGAEILAHIAIVPPAHAVPREFGTPDFWTRVLGHMPFCGYTAPRLDGTQPARQTGPLCVLRFVALDPAGPESAILWDNAQAILLSPDDKGLWQNRGYLDWDRLCRRPPIADPLAEVKLQDHEGKDIVLNGVRLVEIDTSRDCKK
jgi:hypothetical protein